jgi:hypothetical protein
MYLVTVNHDGESHQTLVDDYHEVGGFTVLEKGGREIKVNTNKIEFIEDVPRISGLVVGVIGLLALVAILSR